MGQRPSDADDANQQLGSAPPVPDRQPPSGPSAGDAAPHPAVGAVLQRLGGDVEALVAVSARDRCESQRSVLVDVHHQLRRLAWHVNAALAASFDDQHR
ncbi:MULTISPECIES: hypothetical protein [unclassified Micromonospora]|uniref:hypothetical protein n=1 Tax=unclassified Micromonospora TaxID=2617518 RepID=UPI001C225263|nr:MULTISPECIES: hypothetical protein [unclassified Micromonospora]MBU8857793.1 hypothetical protein [Micromonospora sp. WMMB482]MDM4783424.1 hypothetical protein [Micromonospora sp. b486]